MGLLALRDLAVGVDYEHLAQGHTNIHVGDGVSFPIAEPTVERSLISREQLLNVLQTRNLEHLRFPQDHFPIERP